MKREHIELKAILSTISIVIALAALCFIFYLMLTERPNPSFEDFQKYMAENSDKDSIKDVQLFIPKDTSPQCFANCYNFWFIGYKGPWEKGTEEFYSSEWLDFCAQTCRDRLIVT